MFDNIKLIDDNELKKMIVNHRILKYALFIVFIPLLIVFIVTKDSFWGILSLLSLVWSNAQATHEGILSSRMEVRLKK